MTEPTDEMHKLLQQIRAEIGAIRDQQDTMMATIDRIDGILVRIELGAAGVPWELGKLGAQLVDLKTRLVERLDRLEQAVACARPQ